MPCAAETQAEIQASLIEKTAQQHVRDSIGWIATGMAIQATQYVVGDGPNMTLTYNLCRARLRAHIRDVRRVNPTPQTEAKAKIEIAQRRDKLMKRIEAFIRRSEQFIPPNEDTWINESQQDDDIEGSFGGLGPHIPAQVGIAGTDPECAPLPLPSFFGWEVCCDLGLERLARQEIELRVGEANEALHLLRVSLGKKSLLLRVNVRHARGNLQSTRAWKQVQDLSGKISLQVNLYMRTYKSLKRLNAGPEIMRRFKPITADDLKMSKDVTEENRIGQRNDKLAWFWRFDQTDDIESESQMEECKLSS